jgi:hypothetical protein
MKIPGRPSVKGKALREWLPEQLRSNPVLLQQSGQSRHTRDRSVPKLAELKAEQYQPVLDLSHQLGPRGQEPQAALDRASKRRESIAQILHKGMSANNNVSGRRMLEAPHGSQSLLEMPIIPFQDIVQVFGAPMLGARQDCP